MRGEGAAELEFSKKEKSDKHADECRPSAFFPRPISYRQSLWKTIKDPQFWDRDLLYAPG